MRAATSSALASTLERLEGRTQYFRRLSAMEIAVVPGLPLPITRLRKADVAAGLLTSHQLASAASPCETCLAFPTLA